MSSIEPTFDATTNTLTIPKTKLATHHVNEEKVSGSFVIEEETTVTAKPIPPAHFREGTVVEWSYTPNNVEDEFTGFSESD